MYEVIVSNKQSGAVRRRKLVNDELKNAYIEEVLNNAKIPRNLRIEVKVIPDKK